MTVTTQPVRAIVMDIEGTTGAARHVFDVLFPYSRTRMRAWVEQHADDPVTHQAIVEVAALLGVETTEIDAIVQQLVDWIDHDVKSAPLKAIQGQIWGQGFAAGELTSHMFDDVAPALQAWRDMGVTLCVYSSGSVAAQKALFAHTPQGDLDQLIDANFDITTAGPKRESASYRRIAEVLGIRPDQLLFLSDIQAEIDGARAAGWQAVGVLRQGEEQATVGEPPVISSFAELQVPPAD